MTRRLAFVGDIHGTLDALIGLWRSLGELGQPHTIFLGDFLNKGPQSAAVFELLIELSDSGLASLLLGNHEDSLRIALSTGDLSGFLRIGGAATIRSYVGGAVSSDPISDLLAAFPAHHREALERLDRTFELPGLKAQHERESECRAFQITAHIDVGLVPRINQNGAQIDTGCGGRSDGRLTALLWPSLGFLQVDPSGRLVSAQLATRTFF